MIPNVQKRLELKILLALMFAIASVSGVFMYVDIPNMRADTLHVADQALFQAGHSGRNAVVLSRPEGVAV